MVHGVDGHNQPCAAEMRIRRQILRLMQELVGSCSVGSVYRNSTFALTFRISSPPLHTSPYIRDYLTMTFARSKKPARRTLTADVWELILPYLRRPPVEPQSSPERLRIYQGPLVRMCFVCRVYPSGLAFDE